MCNVFGVQILYCVIVAYMNCHRLHQLEGLAHIKCSTIATQCFTAVSTS